MIVTYIIILMCIVSSETYANCTKIDLEATINDPFGMIYNPDQEIYTGIYGYVALECAERTTQTGGPAYNYCNNGAWDYSITSFTCSGK